MARAREIAGQLLASIAGMPRILVAYASSHGQTRKIANALADELRRGGHEVDLADAIRAAPPPVADYDAVVLGSRVQFGIHARHLVDYIMDNCGELTSTPTYFFSVSMSAAGSPSSDPNGYLEKTFTAVAWRPRMAAVFAGALPYLDYNVLLRWVMKRLSQRAGHTTDTRRNHEFTDWDQVRRFAADIARDLATQVTADPAPLGAPAGSSAGERARERESDASPGAPAPDRAGADTGSPSVEPPHALAVALPTALVAPAPDRPATR